MKDKVAIYARLSREDEDKMYDNQESRSIENQIKVLSDYASENNFEIYNVYYDDGYSGATLDRPSFSKLMQDAKDKKFNILLVKDISRIGRSLHKVGYLIDEFFPENYIRVISLNDKYDSFKYNQNESIVLRNFLNEYYLKEFRKKTKKAREFYAHTKHLNYYPKYGYNFDGDRKEIIDDYSAGIVREIFDYVGNKNMTLPEVAKMLNKEKVLTRSQYATQVLGLKGLNKYPAKEWNASKVYEIVSDYEYCGHSINWKRHKKEERIFLSNTHLAIIDEDTFKKAQEKVASRSTIHKFGERPKHIGKLIFDIKSDRNYVYSRNPKGIDLSYYVSRYSNWKVNARIIEEVVYNDIMNVISCCSNNKEKLYEIYKAKLFNGKEYDKTKLQKQLKKLNEEYSKVIENFYMRKITEIEFKKESKKFQLDIKEVETQINSCDESQSRIALFDIKFKKFLENIKELPNDKIDIIKMAVSKIIITNRKNIREFDITIKYKFEV